MQAGMLLLLVYLLNIVNLPVFPLLWAADQLLILAVLYADWFGRRAEQKQEEGSGNSAEC